MISGESNVGALLDAHPDLVGVPGRPSPALRTPSQSPDVLVEEVRGAVGETTPPHGPATKVAGLPPGHLLVLRAPFEPIPLYEVLGRRGFAHWTERRADDDWAVSFWRQEHAPAPTARGATRAAPATPTIDVRGLPPPQPMVLVLERLTDLGADETLEVLNERRPLFLYPQLDERGFVHETDESAPGLVRIRIRRAPRA